MAAVNPPNRPPLGPNPALEQVPDFRTILGTSIVMLRAEERDVNNTVTRAARTEQQVLTDLEDAWKKDRDIRATAWTAERDMRDVEDAQRREAEALRVQQQHEATMAERRRLAEEELKKLPRVPEPARTVGPPLESVTRECSYARKRIHNRQFTEAGYFISANIKAHAKSARTTDSEERHIAGEISLTIGSGGADKNMKPNHLLAWIEWQDLMPNFVNCLRREGYPLSQCDGWTLLLFHLSQEPKYLRHEVLGQAVITTYLTDIYQDWFVMIADCHAAPELEGWNPYPINRERLERVEKDLLKNEDINRM